jgi:hypothetical protein
VHVPVAGPHGSRLRTPNRRWRPVAVGL